MGLASPVSDLSGAAESAANAEPAASRGAVAAPCKKTRRVSMGIPWLSGSSLGYCNLRAKFRQRVTSRSYSRQIGASYAGVSRDVSAVRRRFSQETRHGHQ